MCTVGVDGLINGTLLWEVSILYFSFYLLLSHCSYYPPLLSHVHTTHMHAYIHIHTRICIRTS